MTSMPPLHNTAQSTKVYLVESTYCDCMVFSIAIPLLISNMVVFVILGFQGVIFTPITLIGYLIFTFVSPFAIPHIYYKLKGYAYLPTFMEV